MSVLSKLFIGDSLCRNGLYLIVNKVSVCLLGFVFWKVMAGIFAPNVIGIGSTLVSVSSFLAIVSSLGLGWGLIRFIPEFVGFKIELVNNVFTVGSIVAVTLGVVFLFGTRFWFTDLDFISRDFILIWAFVFFVWSNTFAVLVESSMVAQRSAKYVLSQNLIAGCVRFPLSLLLAQTMKGFGIYAGFGLSFFVGNLFGCIYFLPKVYQGFKIFPMFEYLYVKKIFCYSCVNYLANCFNLTPQFIYPLMVLNVLGPEESGFFWIAWMMVSVLSIIPISMSQSLLAEGSFEKSKLVRNGRVALIISIVLSAVGVVVMFLFGRTLLLFFGYEYANNGVTPMKYMAIAVVPQCVNMIYLAVNQVKKNVVLIVAQTFSLGVLVIILGLLFLNLYGLNGLGIAYFVSQSIIAIIVGLPLFYELKKIDKNVRAKEVNNNAQTANERCNGG